MESAESLHQQYEPEAPIHKAVNITSRMLKDRVEPFQHDEYDLWKARDPETGRESDHWWDTPEKAVEFLAHDIDLDLCCVNECDNYLGEDSDRIMCDDCDPDEYIDCAEDGCDYPTNHVKTDYCSGHTWRNGRTADEKNLVTDGGATQQTLAGGVDGGQPAEDGQGDKHRIACHDCGEPIEGWMNTRTFGEWDVDAQNYRRPPGIRNHYCEECWGDDFGRANGAHFEPTSAQQLYDVLDAADGDLAAVLTWWSGRPAIRVVDGEVEAAVTKPRDGGETEDGTPILKFESELIEDFDREQFNEDADPPEDMNLVLLLKPERTPFHGVDGGEAVAQ